jgi:PilZ domain
MQLVSFPARQARSHYRHELRTLTYVTLDSANGGIVRNLNSEGVAVQAVAPLREQQRVRLRFDLRFPRLRVDTFGEVSWAGSSGRCGIRFVEMPAQTARQINQWIFSNLLDEASREAEGRSIFGTSSASPGVEAIEEDTLEEIDGLTISAGHRTAIRIEQRCDERSESQITSEFREENPVNSEFEAGAKLNWLSRPISGRTLAWLVDSLVMIAGVLLFALIFLSITHELPPWPLTAGAASSAAVLVAAMYWALFAVFGGASLGSRLADAASTFKREEEDAERFR